MFKDFQTESRIKRFVVDETHFLTISNNISMWILFHIETNMFIAVNKKESITISSQNTIPSGSYIKNVSSYNLLINAGFHDMTDKRDADIFIYNR